MDQKTWSVYRHTFPNGKVYIGASCQPEVRWANGMGYASNQKMFRDIVLYGWRNIAHEILFDGMTEDAAHEKERELIESFGKKGREKTYNHQYADYLQPDKREDDWLELEISEETLRKYKWQFCQLNDIWLEPYIQQMGLHPFGEDLGVDGITINFIHAEDGEYFVHDILTGQYPKRGMTFREVYHWLMTAPKMEKIQLKRVKMSDEMIAAIKGA